MLLQNTHECATRLRGFAASTPRLLFHRWCSMQGSPVHIHTSQCTNTSEHVWVTFSSYTFIKPTQKYKMLSKEMKPPSPTHTVYAQHWIFFFFLIQTKAGLVKRGVKSLKSQVNCNVEHAPRSRSKYFIVFFEERVSQVQDLRVHLHTVCDLFALHCWDTQNHTDWIHITLWHSTLPSGPD